MKPLRKILSRRAPGALPPGLWLAVALLGMAATQPPPAPQPATPATPREFFNAGNQKLREHKLKEAEAWLESALASQDERLQPDALFNAGHVRFDQGKEDLKKGPAAGPTLARGQAAARQADEAIRAASDALAANELNQMIAAYRRGRGLRKELKDATAAVRRALQTHGTALSKWQRASGDFHGASELEPKAEDARQNADIVDRCIARLVDSVRELQQMANALGDKKQDLGQKLKELRGRIPDEDAPPGAAGDDEDEEDKPNGPEPGQEEGAAKEGDQNQMMITEEQAGWLLEGFRLDSDRRLPMGQSDQAEPRNRNRPTW